MKKSFTGRTGAVIGWGKDGSSGAGTKRLKYAFLPIISNKECSTYWAVTEKHVCTSASYHQDACQVNNLVISSFFAIFLLKNAELYWFYWKCRVIAVAR